MSNSTCPHAQRCIHPCDADECFLESIEQPNGPAVPLTKEQCDAIEKRMEQPPIFACPMCTAPIFVRKNQTIVSHYNGDGLRCSANETIYAPPAVEERAERMRQNLQRVASDVAGWPGSKLANAEAIMYREDKAK